MKKFFIENFRVEKKYQRIINVFLWFFVILALIMTLITFVKQSNSNGFFKLGNSYYFAVQTNDMSGKDGFGSGDIVVVNTLTNADIDQLTHGDVITYYKNNGTNKVSNIYIKRIFEVLIDSNDERVFIVKGDTEDAKNYAIVEKNSIIGKWTGIKIPLIGGFIQFLQTYPGYIMFIALPLLIFFVYELVTLIATLKRGSNLRSKIMFDKDYTKHRNFKSFDASRYSSSFDSDSLSSASSHSKDSSSTKNKKKTIKPTIKKSIKSIKNKIKTKPSSKKTKVKAPKIKSKSKKIMY